MSNQWEFQIRVYLSDELAELARSDPGSLAIKPLTDILAKHHATMKSQFDAFADYVAEAEKHGIEHFPLYQWTKVTIEDPIKKAKHIKAFALRVHGRELYAKEIADALEADLRPLVESKVITSLSKQDNDPAHNLPVPKQFRS